VAFFDAGARKPMPRLSARPCPYETARDGHSGNTRSPLSMPIGSWHEVNRGHTRYNAQGAPRKETTTSDGEDARC